MDEEKDQLKSDEEKEARSGSVSPRKKRAKGGQRSSNINTRRRALQQSNTDKSQVTSDSDSAPSKKQKTKHKDKEEQEETDKSGNDESEEDKSGSEVEKGTLKYTRKRSDLFHF